jgi:hypothetical protein
MFALRAPSSEIQHHVVRGKSNYVPEEHVASIFRVEKNAKQESGLKAGGKLVSCLAYSSILKMKATCSSETSVDFQRTLWCCIPEDKALHGRCSENHKPYKCLLVYLKNVPINLSTK